MKNRQVAFGLMNLNLRFFPIRHAGAGRHPENEANRGGIWIPAKRAAQRGELLVMTN
jgi:hypothetical protein